MLDQNGLYRFDGFQPDDPLIFFNNYPPIDVKKGVEYKVWRGYDLKAVTAQTLTDTHCIDVDVSCLVWTKSQDLFSEHWI